MMGRAGAGVRMCSGEWEVSLFGAAAGCSATETPRNKNKPGHQGLRRRTDKDGAVASSSTIVKIKLNNATGSEALT
jgi:hypothetical protein